MRALMASAAIAAALALAGCDNDKIPNISGRHMQPLSEELLAELDQKQMAKESPILVRIFKEEAELEVWKVDKGGRFALLRTYPICRWSGDLGPKIQQGDRQAPEGFYTITPDLMNPNSHYHLAINTGFPNAYDRANGRSGTSLMIHGDCASVGCYAMTDEQITDIYSLAREAFFGGQRSFQIQAYPFRMSPLNMARHRDSPHLAFWTMLKQGYDHFEVTHKEPKIAVCDKHYVFNAQSSTKFRPEDPCPAYNVPQQIASAVQKKQHHDEIETAALISRGVPAAAATTGGDGGMNSDFLSALRANGGPGTTIRTASGTIPAHVRPPADPSQGLASMFAIGSSEVRPATVHVATAAPSSSSISAFFGNLFSSKRENQSVGARENAPAQNAQAKSEPAVSSVPMSGSARNAALAAAHTNREVQPVDDKTASAKPPSSPAPQQASAQPVAAGGRTSNLLSGALPIMPAGSFENRFGDWH